MSGPFFEAQTLGLGRLLSDGSLFFVPHHQRDYTWTEDEIEQLFNDIREAKASNQDDYFLGLVVFIRKQDGGFTILDGQQRMATAIIILSAIRTWLRGYKFDGDADQIQNEYIAIRELGAGGLTSRLILNETNNQTFCDFAINEVPPEDIYGKLSTLKRHDPNRRLLEAILFCRKKIQELTETEAGAPKEKAEKLFELVRYLRDKVKIIRFGVSDEANAYTIFETLNDRGLDLTVLDLLKNYLFSKAGSNISLRDIKTQWTQMMATLANVRADDFLKAYWTSRYGRTQTAQLFPSIRKEIRAEKNAVEMSKNMLRTSEQYAVLEIADDPLWEEYSKEAKEHVRALKLLGSKQVHPVILSALEKFSQGELQRLLRLLEVLIVRYQLICGKRTGRLEIACAKLAKDIFDKKVKTATEAYNNLRDIYPADDEFEDSFTFKQERSDSKVLYLLRKLEIEAAKRKKKGEMIADELGPRETLTVEHVLPKSPGREWEPVLQKDPTLAEDYIYRLGNLCLLTNINRKLGNKPYSEKKRVFQKSGLVLTLEAGQCQEWDRSVIEERQKKMANLALSVWRFQ